MPAIDNGPTITPPPDDGGDLGDSTPITNVLNISGALSYQLNGVIVNGTRAKEVVVNGNVLYRDLVITFGSRKFKYWHKFHTDK